MSLRLDHTVVPVRTDRMFPATQFFLDIFGYAPEVVDHQLRIVKGDWGIAKFVINKEGDRLQLTMPVDQQPYLNHLRPWEAPISAPMLPWVHVAFACDVPATLEAIKTWAQFPVTYEEVPGGKWFVSLHTVLWVDIELVPQV